MRNRAWMFACIAGLTLGFAVDAEAAEPRAVRSLLEMRRENVVMQEWDLSCGAAVITTVLNYQHGDMVTEKDVATTLMQRSEYVDNPLLVQVRQGFSLLDLKRLVDSRGYQGVGLGQMTFEHLLERAPVIVPIRTNGYNHFVVFRGQTAGRVLLADPAWGNRTMSRDDFEAVWIDYGDLGHVGFIVTKDGTPAPPAQLAARPEDFWTFN